MKGNPVKTSGGGTGYRNSAFWRTYDKVAQYLDDRKKWYKLPMWPGLLTLVGVRNILRKNNLFDTRSAPSNTEPPVPPFESRYNYQRTPDGTYNDLSDPAMGMVNSRFGRNIPLESTWPEAEEALLSPNPRTVSRRLLHRTEFIPATSVNSIAAAWLQFMIRDWFSHGKGDPSRVWTIKLDPDDDFPEQPMTIMRTIADPTRPEGSSDHPPTYINTETHWWDGSSIYGTSLEMQQRARSGEDGKLKVGLDGRIPMDPKHDPTEEPGFWLGMVMLHTLFTLEHNAICDELKRHHPRWSDEDLFQRARLINAALLAKIHTMEWTPAVISHPITVTALRANWFGLEGERLQKLFGRIVDDEVIGGIPGSETDHYGIPYSLTEEFTSVYRMHPLIPDDWTLRSLKDDRLLAAKNFRELTGKEGAVIAATMEMDDLFYSFGTEHPGLVTLHNSPRFLEEFLRPDGHYMDIGAIDIMRVRELGVPRYCEFRRYMHLPAPKTFEELTDNPQWAQEIREVYDGDIERVDLAVGMFAEPKPAGFAFSDTAFRIFVLMASRRLNSDRFFNRDFNANVYTPAGMKWLQDNQMLQVLTRHMPNLVGPLRGLKNAFEPWHRAGAGGE
jgi:hypothetical protein